MTTRFTLELELSSDAEVTDSLTAAVKQAAHLLRASLAPDAETEVTARLETIRKTRAVKFTLPGTPATATDATTA